MTSPLRHTCFLLQTLYKHLNVEDLQDVSELLEEIVQEARDAHQLDKAAVPFLKGFLDSPIPLTEFPQVRSFTPQVRKKLLQYFCERTVCHAGQGFI